jgi:signal transduction histidine kinase
MDPDDPADAAAVRDLALDELDRMRRLTDSLVTLAQSGRAGFARLAPLDLAPWFDEVVDKARALGDRDWRVESRTELLAMADQHRLTEAVLELAANAVKHSEDGSTITFGLAEDRGQARVWVKDHGVGVAAVDRQRIFQRFERGSRPVGDQPPGAGLGLAIVQRIAEAHSGRVELESAVGIGSVFTVVLPTLTPGGDPPGGIVHAPAAGPGSGDPIGAAPAPAPAPRTLMPPAGATPGDLPYTPPSPGAPSLEGTEK